MWMLWPVLCSGASAELVPPLTPSAFQVELRLSIEFRSTVYSAKKKCRRPLRKGPLFFRNAPDPRVASSSDPAVWLEAWPPISSKKPINGARPNKPRGDKSLTTWTDARAWDVHGRLVQLWT
jgi:hypothetical protein